MKCNNCIENKDWCWIALNFKSIVKWTGAKIRIVHCPEFKSKKGK